VRAADVVVEIVGGQCLVTRDGGCSVGGGSLGGSGGVSAESVAVVVVAVVVVVVVAVAVVVCCCVGGIGPAVVVGGRVVGGEPVRSTRTLRSLWSRASCRTISSRTRSRCDGSIRHGRSCIDINTYFAFFNFPTFS
jgi:hypothetical protein